MNIAFDLVGTKKNSGSKTYLYNFIKVLISEENEELISEKFSDKYYLFITRYYYKQFKHISNKKIKFIIKPDFFGEGIFKLIWMQFILPYEILCFKISKIFSSLNYCPIFFVNKKVKKIIVIHSLLPFVYPKYLPKNYLTKYFTRYFMLKSIKSAHGIIVLSDYQKKELLEKILIDKNKLIKKIYLGADHIKIKNKKFLNRFNYNSKDNYLICVSSCAPYHNLLEIISAIYLLNKEIKVKLLLVTQILDKKYFGEIRKAIKNYKIEDKVQILINIDNDFLPNLFEVSSGYIFSSLTETFGITTLEAMMHSLPVLVSNNSSLPEINGEAALYFKHNDINDIKEKMKAILTNAKLRDELVLHGLANSKKYIWKKTISETLSFIKEI